MSYWNIHEQKPGKYNFKELDWQLNMAAKYQAKVTLCLGKRQPRWPECHMPEWAQSLPTLEWRTALYDYIQTVVNRYKNHPAIESWQLENEALLKSFGHCPDGDYSRTRLHKEFDLVRKLDPTRPIIMTLSDSWGIPLRNPTPDMYAMSLYRITINKHGKYAYSKRPPSFYRNRGSAIGVVKDRPVFIHELQAEPWLSKKLTKTSLKTQLKYMNETIIKENIDFALKTGMRPIDLWGLEWCYYLKTKHKNPDIWNAVGEILAT